MGNRRRISRPQALALPGLLLFAACGHGGSDSTSDPARYECAPQPASTMIVNVRDEGAKGDGRTDDTVAIQAVVDAVGGTGGTVYVPGGVYGINPTAILPRPA